MIQIMIVFGLLFWPYLTFAQTSRRVGEAIELAREQLLSAQEPDGSIGDFGTSGWAAMALTASGTPSSDARFAKLKNYLEAASFRVDKASATELERTILSLVAIGFNPYNIGGRNLVEELKALENDGQIGSPNLLNDDIFAILAFRATGQDPADQPFRSAIDFVKRNQQSNGGFNDRVGAGQTDIDTTAVAVLALRPFADTTAAGELLTNAQNSDGGFPSRIGQSSNVASTSWAAWAIGVNQGSFDYLVSQQDSSGSYGSLLVTSYALHALSGKSLPLGLVRPPATAAAQPSETTSPTTTQPLPTQQAAPIIEPTQPSQPVQTQLPQTQQQTAGQRRSPRRVVPPARARVDQPISRLSAPVIQTAPSTFLVAGSFPQETITQFVTSPKTVELARLKTPVTQTSPGVVILLVILTTLTLVNTFGLLALWRKISAPPLLTQLTQQPSIPS